MSWFSLSANQTAAEAEHVTMFLAVDLDLLSGHLRLWTGYGDITIGGNTYTGVGQFARVSYPNERVGLDPTRKTFGLSGAELTPGMIAESDIDGSFRRSVVEYLGFLTSAGALVDEPEICWEGCIDSIRRSDGPEPSIEVNAEHRLVVLKETDKWRYSAEHQAQFYASDTGFNFITSSLLRELMWGGRPVPGGVTGAGGGGRTEPRQNQR